MLRNDEFLEQIGYLQRANRFWKGLAFGLAAVLVLFLVLGTLVGFSLYFQAQNRRNEVDAMMREARQQEAVARRQAEDAEARARQEAERARQTVDKQKAQP
jgi:hypothetical protein